LGNVFGRRTDGRGIGGTLHLALREIPMPDFYPETAKAKQHRQHYCRYDGNGTC
jgi:hypothetical protein